jgi:hypothetical protein
MHARCTHIDASAFRNVAGQQTFDLGATIAGNAGHTFSALPPQAPPGTFASLSHNRGAADAAPGVVSHRVPLGGGSEHGRRLPMHTPPRQASVGGGYRGGSRRGGPAGEACERESVASPRELKVQLSLPRDGCFIDLDGDAAADLARRTGERWRRPCRRHMGVTLEP